MTADRRFSRRSLLIGGGAGLATGVAATLGAAAVVGVPTDQSVAENDATPAHAQTVTPTGWTQAGIARPGTPQQNGLVVSLDFTDRDLPGFLSGLPARLAALGDAITRFTSPSDFDPLVVPDGPGDLTVTVGLGPEVIGAIDSTLPGSRSLPLFAGDEMLAPANVGGDLLLGIYSSNPGPLHDVVSGLVAAVGSVSVRWQQRCFRATGEGTVTRNPFGYHDGIIVPHGADELAENVWIDDKRLAGATICVIRRLRLNVAGFSAEPTARQDAIIGRTRQSGAPLSGGRAHAEVNLLAKSASGEFLTPARSHARAAHPSFTGSALMLRRGYAYAGDQITGPDGSLQTETGLMFICFQRDLETFTKTQFRLDETDDLMAYSTPTASATFVVLPGFDSTNALGSALFTAAAERAATG